MFYWILNAILCINFKLISLHSVLIKQKLIVVYIHMQILFAFDIEKMSNWRILREPARYVFSLKEHFTKNVSVSPLCFQLKVSEFTIKDWLKKLGKLKVFWYFKVINRYLFSWKALSYILSGFWIDLYFGVTNFLENWIWLFKNIRD